MSVDLNRLDALNEAFNLYKLKSCADIEEFLINPTISDREKVESLYSMSVAYNYILEYIDGRIDDLNNLQS